MPGDHSAALWVNANVSWHGQLKTTYDGVRGCDEGCAAYLYAAVLDASTDRELPGYGLEQTIAMMNVDGQHMPLRWRQGGGGGGAPKGCVWPQAAGGWQAQQGKNHCLWQLHH